MTPPNVYADQIEWMSGRLKSRDSIVLSIHPHNDRGCGVAAAELAVMAGAQRIEGCPVGNGERTRNLCPVTPGLEPFPQGGEPGIAVFHIHQIVRNREQCKHI